MNLIVEPLRLDEVEEFISIQYAAFAVPELVTMQQMVYPKGLQPDFVARFSQRLLAALKNSPEAQCFCAKDADNGNEIVAVAQWDVFREPPRTAAEIEAVCSRAAAGTAQLPAVDGMNTALNDAFYKVLMETMTPLTGGEPHAALILLATHPKHHRKGAGSLLMRHGLAKADEAKLPVTILAGRSGKPLYERFGFEVVKELPFDAREYGGSNRVQYWCMIRQAQS